jgi:hypothetical protein
LVTADDVKEEARHSVYNAGNPRFVHLLIGVYLPGTRYLLYPRFIPALYSGYRSPLNRARPAGRHSALAPITRAEDVSKPHQQPHSQET